MAKKRTTTTVLDSTGVHEVKIDPIVMKVLGKAESGFNINQIASQLGIHSHIVKQILDENL